MLFHVYRYNSSGLEGYFAIGWLLFALMVIAGNLTGLLYTPSKKKRATA